MNKGCEKKTCRLSQRCLQPFGHLLGLMGQAQLFEQMAQAVVGGFHGVVLAQMIGLWGLNFNNRILFNHNII